jgi:hypothetical protein
VRIEMPDDGDWRNPGPDQCWSGDADAHGALAFQTMKNNLGFHPGVHFFSLSGGAATYLTSTWTTAPGAMWPIAQPSGFMVFDNRAAGASDLEYYANGAFVTSVMVTPEWVPPNKYATPARIAADPAGGMAVLRLHDDTAVTTYQRLGPDAAAAPEIPIATGADAPQAVAVSRSGNVLAVVDTAGDATHLRARWLTRDGAPLGDWFPLDESWAIVDMRSSFTLSPMIDGAIARATLSFEYVASSTIVHLGIDRIVPDGQAMVAAAPDWVRGASAQYVVLGGRATALTRFKEDSLTVVAPSGKVCGTLSIPGLGDIYTGHAQVGRDGSFIFPTWSAPGGCTVYPGLFR